MAPCRHFDAAAVGAKMALFTGADATAEQKATWANVEKIFKRFAAADVYVVNTPLWNNNIPYVLKQFIDLVTQPGWTFGFDMEKGYSGLLSGKRALLSMPAVSTTRASSRISVRLCNTLS